MKTYKTKKKAFTLIELLIVIAIIGILFIVLVSKVDFATDKAKATGVQTDFRSFQVAIETVAKENSGLATFGWDTGDENGNRIRDSYDRGDTNKNGKQDDGEIFVGSKTYGEEWTNIYTLTNPADANDMSAIFALEAAINKNLDPKLHITIHDDYTITMANQARDPWGNEYYGYYISNAENDGKDRGAIVIFSSGANGEHGCEHGIAEGMTAVSIPGNNVQGKDDYSISVIYTYINGYGEVKTTTTGFSNNQGDNNTATNIVTPGSNNSSTQSEKTYQFSNSILNSTLKELFDASTYGTQEDDYVVLIDSDVTYLELYRLDGDIYGLYYHNYVTDAAYDYETLEIAEVYDDIVGWHDCRNNYESTDAPFITITPEEEEYIYMPNGSKDLAPLFVSHKHTYTNCICICGQIKHALNGNFCTNCKVYFETVYYGMNDYDESIAVVFHIDGTLSISDFIDNNKFYPDRDSDKTKAFWHSDTRIMNFYTSPHSTNISYDYFVVADNGETIEYVLGYGEPWTYAILTARFDIIPQKFAFDTPIYNQYGDAFVFHSDSTAHITSHTSGETGLYHINWISSNIFYIEEDNHHFGNEIYISMTGDSIYTLYLE